MKNTLIRLLPCLLVWLCLAACRPKPYPPLLLAADSLTSVWPDSACALLASFAADTARQPRHIRMYHRLLCVKANDKAYIPHTSDSVILPVVAYYERHKDLSRLPEAYYYAGRVYADLGDAPQALDYFQQALEVMSENQMHSLHAKVYSQAGNLLAYQCLYSDALIMIKRSLKYNLQIKDSIGIFFCYRDIANTFRALAQIDSASYYIEKSCELSRMIKRSDLWRLAQIESIYFNITKKNYTAAHTSIQEITQNMETIDRNGIYSVAARYYYETNQKDSAQWYMQELVKYGNIYSKEQSYRGLAEIALTKGNTRDAAHYLSNSLLLLDSIRKMTDSETLARMNTLYNYQLRTKKNNDLRLKNERQYRYNFYLTTGSIVLLILAYSLHRYRKRTLLRRLWVAEQLQEEAYRNSQQFVEDNQKHIYQLESQIKDLNIQLQGSSLQCEQLQQQIDILSHMNRQVELEQNKRLLDENLFFNSALYTLFRQKLETGQNITPTEWRQLAAQLDSSFDGFTQKLARLGQLKENEYRASLLIKAKFKNKDIAILLHLSPEGVSSLRRRLCIKFFPNSSEAKEWDKFIHSL